MRKNRSSGVPRLLFCLLALVVVLPAAPAAAQEAGLDLYVSSRNTNSVKRYDGTTGAYLGDFVAPGAGGLEAPQEVAFGPGGHLYVSGRGNNRILTYDGRSGAFLGAFTSGRFLSEPTKMTFGPDGLLYVSQWGNGRISRFDAETGAYVDDFPDVTFAQPMDHAWDAGGRLYVAVFGSQEVRRFDADGTGGRTFISSAHLQGPVNLWFGADGDLYVADWPAGAVKRFDGRTGAFRADFVTGMSRTEGVTFGPDGALYVCDWMRNLVNRYDPATGDLLGIFASSGRMRAPNSLVFGPAASPTGSLDTPRPPDRSHLEPGYPNPFTATTTIRYTLAEPGFVALNVFDLQGRLHATLVHEHQAAGVHEIPFTPSGGSPGVYLYELVTPRERGTRMMTQLR